ncbi:hypothetical protein CHH83_02690 [Bacillus sp. 7586-K]|nr:hypothetical protein CHH83_02690 [Bacillus sp. 7586-K]
MSEKKYLNISNLSFRMLEQEDYNIIKDFDCGNSSLERFLKQEAYYSNITRVASTSLVFSGTQLVAFFTLRKTQLSIDADTSQLESLSCIDISRVAVDKRYQEKGVGCAIIKRIIELANTVNERFLTLDALIEKYDWYVNRGFVPLIEDETKKSNQEGLVYMVMDLYDESLIDQYLDLAI